MPVSCARPCSAVVLFLVVVAGLAAPCGAQENQPKLGIYNPLHGYDTRPVNDRFTRFLNDWEAGKAQLDAASDLAFLRSLLKQLEVPVSSQMLVFTATSLQKGLISARNPRAIYFNDDTYVGFVPRGRVE